MKTKNLRSHQSHYTRNNDDNSGSTATIPQNLHGKLANKPAAKTKSALTSTKIYLTAEGHWPTLLLHKSHAKNNKQTREEKLNAFDLF